MKKINLTFRALFLAAGAGLLLTLAACTSKRQEGNDLNLHLATLEEAQRIISTSDSFTKSLNAFDLQSRLQEHGMTPSEENYLELGRQSVREWTAAEKAIIARATALIQHKIDSGAYHLPIPDEITLIKTTMEEEGGAGGYTRGNCIFLCPLEEVKPEQEKMVAIILAHELIHVMSRTNDGFRQSMYAHIGFELLDEDIDFGPALTAMRITNPDVNRYDSYSMFSIDGEEVPCAMIYYNDKEYTGGPFFMYGKPGLVRLDDEFRPMMPTDPEAAATGLPIICSTTDAEDFYDLIGMNTGYVINPEEVLADNFAYALLDLYPEGHPSPEVTERLRAVMQGIW